MRIKTPEVFLTVTEDHFARAVPGDPCHCTIGEATKDALDRIIPALELKDVDAATISVHPADIGGEPAVSVGFVATDKRDQEVTVRFLLEEASAFKVAYVTDNRGKKNMQRAAARKPYALRASVFQIRKRDARTRPDLASNVTVIPERHIQATATSAAHYSKTAEAAADRTVGLLTRKAKAGELPYALTPQLRKLARQRAAASFEARGSQPRATSPVKVYKNKRFYG